MSYLRYLAIACLIFELCSALKQVSECPKMNHKGQRLYHLVHADCNKFYKCDHGKLYEYKCDDGLFFNTQLEVCDYPAKVNCKPSKVTCPKKNISKLHHLPHRICSKFYKCNFGEPVEMDCPIGQHFLPKLELCGHASKTTTKDCVNE